MIRFAKEEELEYEEKYEDLSAKIQKHKENIEILQENVSNQKDVGKQMASLKKAISAGVNVSVVLDVVRANSSQNI